MAQQQWTGVIPGSALAQRSRMSLLKPPTSSIPQTPSRQPGGLVGVVDGMASLSMGPGRISDSRVSMAGLSTPAYSQRTIVPNSALSAQRRSSAFSTRPSISNSNGPTKETRPIRDKQWQANSIRTLISFLVQTGYNQAVSQKTLQSPSAKDFQNIFKFIYAQLDPHFAYTKKFEEEVPIIMKGLRYPFADQISKSHLYSVGTMHAWPSLLALLTWMVELILVG
ncbi:kinetochore-associated Ndc80 complex subunit ndc80, partial [Nowakowskiella sp. JEL0078]